MPDPNKAPDSIMGLWDEIAPLNQPITQCACDPAAMDKALAELREIRRLLQQVIGLPDTPITRAVKKSLEGE